MLMLSSRAALIEKRIDRIEREMESCRLCPRECAVDRMAGERGYCGLGVEGRVFHHYFSFSEEIEISPTYEILFSGCSLRCEFCSVLDQVRDPEATDGATFDEVRRGVDAARSRGLRSISFVGGEPAVNLLAILRLLAVLPHDLPIAWNSNLYQSDVVHEVLDGLVDFVVADLHWGNDDCARRISGAGPCIEQIQEGIVRAATYARVVLRHLRLPGHEDCCVLPIQAWHRRVISHVELRLMDSLTIGFSTPGARGQDYLEEILIEPDGRVAIKHLGSGLLGLLPQLNPLDARIHDLRAVAASPTGRGGLA